MPLKILVHSANGDGIALANRFKKEGAQVWVYIEEKGCRRIGDGLVDKVDSVTRGMAEKPDFVLFDMSGSGELADRLRKAGTKVIGSSAMADKMETDRKFGLDLMKNNGIKIPVTAEFKTIEDALFHVKQNPKAYAIKMSGGDSGCASSYVAKDAADMLDYISYQKEQKLIKPGMEFVLQEVVKGVEISTEVWFSQGTPLLPYNGTFEIKKFMPGDLGPNTGCETSVVFPYLSSSPKIIEKTIKKIFPFMAKEKYTGPLDINCIVSEKDWEPYGLEWTPRLGYSAIYALSALMDSNLSEFFYGVAYGKTQRVPAKHSWATSLKVSVPPYPLDGALPEAERQLYDQIEGLRIKSPPTPHFWPVDAQKDSKGRLVVAGVNGIVGECTGSGETLEKAWEGSKKVFEDIEIPNKMGRILDGIESATKRATKLRAMKYDIPKISKEVSPSPLPMELSR